MIFKWISRCFTILFHGAIVLHAISRKHLFLILKMRENKTSSSQLEQSLISFGYFGQFSFFNTGRSALEFSLKFIAEQNLTKKEIVVSSFTCGVVGAAIIHAGLKPVFCDIEPDYPCASFDEIFSKLTENTLAVITAHIGGYPVHGIDKIESLCKEKKIYLIDDAAQAFGLQINNRLAGTFGDFGILSFGAGKSIVGIGGGVLIANNTSLAPKVVKSNDKPTKNKNQKLHLIWNSYLNRNRFVIIIQGIIQSFYLSKTVLNSNLVPENKVDSMTIEQMTFAIVGINLYNENQQKCISNLQIYTNYLNSNKTVALCLDSNSTYSKLWLKFTEAQNVEVLQKYLLTFGIYTELGAKPLHLRKAFEQKDKINLINSEKFYNQFLAIPFRSFHTKKEIKRVTEKLRPND